MKLLYVLLGSMIQTAYAQEDMIRQFCEGLHPGCGAGRLFIVQLANRIIDLGSNILGGVAVTTMCIGGIRFIVSAGNDEGKTQGKNVIVAGLVGLFFAITGKAFVYFVGDFVQTYTPPIL